MKASYIAILVFVLGVGLALSRKVIAAKINEQKTSGNSDSSKPSTAKIEWGEYDDDFDPEEKVSSGDFSANTKEIQLLLNYILEQQGMPELDEDGKFGSLTYSAVKRYVKTPPVSVNETENAVSAYFKSKGLEDPTKDDFLASLFSGLGGAK